MQSQTSSIPKIFILDDDKDIVSSLTTLFESENCYVASATNAHKLTERLDKFKPDLLLIDVVLKVDNGNKISQELKAHSSYRHIPIILMLAIYDFHHQTSSNPIFADDYIDKPFSNSEIVEKVLALMRED
ncbi:response regulator [Pedobacter agri]|uniref:response regulator n=1 Tax=Pedobacter agri TaxID=454586 RepID=UPI00292DC961|nr:response regulator [Pedobacter agri]